MKHQHGRENENVVGERYNDENEKCLKEDGNDDVSERMNIEFNGMDEMAVCRRGRRREYACTEGVLCRSGQKSADFPGAGTGFGRGTG